MKKFAVWFGLIFTLLIGSASAQSGGTLDILSTDVRNLPNVSLEIQATDGLGQTVDLLGQTPTITQNGVQAVAQPVTSAVQNPTFTIFLVDVTESASDSIAAIRDAVLTYSSDPYMEESSDFVAVYYATTDKAQVYQSPTTFHNEVINAFTINPLAAGQQVTALRDSIGDVMERASGLQPGRERTVNAIVVFSDGTDSISTRYQEDQLIGQALDRQIPVHTVWLENPQLQSASIEQGQSFMRGMAQATGGIYAELRDEATLENLWSIIDSSANQYSVDFSLADIEAGDQTISVSFPNALVLPTASANINFPGNLPIASINLPEESRNLSLEDETPIELTIPSEVRWLDGSSRDVTLAQYLVNGLPTNVENIGDQVALPLRFGTNTVQLDIRDENGNRSISDPVTLTVTEGNQQIPRELSGGGSVGLIRNLLLGLVVLLGLAILGLVLRRQLAGNSASDTSIEKPLAKEVQPEPSPPPQPNPEPMPEPAVQKVPDNSQSIIGDIERREPPQPIAEPILNPDPKPAVSAELPKPPEPEKIEPMSAPTMISSRVEPPNRSITPTATPMPTAQIEVLGAETNLRERNPITRPEFLLGRSPSVDLAFPQDPTVSRIHATVVLEGMTYRIFDEQSTSGTYVNDALVPEHGIPLMDGDEIHLGAVHLRFRQSS